MSGTFFYKNKKKYAKTLDFSFFACYNKYDDSQTKDRKLPVFRIVTGILLPAGYYVTMYNERRFPDEA